MVTIAKSASARQAQERRGRGRRAGATEVGAAAVYNAVLRRYWYHAWWFYAHSIVRGGIDKVHVGLEIKPAAEKTRRFGPAEFSGPEASPSATTRGCRNGGR